MMLQPLFPAEMRLCQPDDDSGEGQYGDQVRDGHEAVECIGDLPDDVQIKRGAGDDDQYVNQLICFNASDAEQELGAPDAVKRPATVATAKSDMPTEMITPAAFPPNTVANAEIFSAMEPPAPI